MVPFKLRVLNFVTFTVATDTPRAAPTLVASRGLCYSPVRASQAGGRPVADRRSNVWGGTRTASWSWRHGEGVARATRSRWALGARGRAGPSRGPRRSRDFYSRSVPRRKGGTNSCMWSGRLSECLLNPWQVGGGYRIPWATPCQLPLRLVGAGELVARESE